MKSLFTLILLGCFIASTAQPGKLSSLDSVFTFDNTPFKTVLEVIGKYHHIRICNPRLVTGLSISGNFLRNNSVQENCDIITCIESGAVFLNYQNGVIYVSKKAFPKKFKPHPSDWPCN